MRTLFVGAGATGGYFGGRLAQAGRDVTFLVRPGRAAVLADRGLRIRQPDGATDTIAVRTVTADALDGPYDVVVLTVKAYGLQSALEDMTPAIGPDTVIVPVLNGLRHLDTLVERFGAHHVYGGICMVMTTLADDGDIVQIGPLEQLKYGPLDGGPDDRLERVRQALSGAAFGSDSSLTIMQEMWEKWALLSSLGAVTCLMRGTVGEVTAAAGGEAFALGVADEAIAIATAAGYEPRPAMVEMLRGGVSQKGSPMTSSMYRDLSAGRPVEGDHLVGDLVRHAAELGVPAPLLALAATSLSVYELKRQAEDNAAG